MSSVKNDQFYSRLPVNHIALSDLLMEEHLFYPVPGNVLNGMHENVNLVATGSIVTILNIAFKAGITQR